MAYGSTVPAALSALDAALTAAALPVFVGPQINASAARQAVLIGYTATDTPVVELRVNPVTATLDSQREQYGINNCIRVLQGGKDTVAAAADAYTLLGQVGAALTADHTLGGTVMMARISASTLILSQTPKGAMAELDFTVDIDAFTTD